MNCWLQSRGDQKAVGYGIRSKVARSEQAIPGEEEIWSPRRVRGWIGSLDQCPACYKHDVKKSIWRSLFHLYCKPHNSSFFSVKVILNRQGLYIESELWACLKASEKGARAKQSSQAQQSLVPLTGDTSCWPIALHARAEQPLGFSCAAGI